MHDAVRVVHRDGAVLPQTLPLERRAERADLVLLVLLLLGELHEHLRDTETEDFTTLTVRNGVFSSADTICGLNGVRNAERL